MAEQREQHLTSEERITQLFTDWTAEKLLIYFSERTRNLLDFAGQVIMICLKEISHNNPAHLTNIAMNRCFIKFKEWGMHLASGNRALVWKLMHNGLILWHQCERYKWYHEADEDDETKKALRELINADDYGQSLVSYLRSMYIFFLSDNILYCFTCAFLYKINRI